MSLSFVWSDFDGLTPHALYAALRLRQQVFAIEQHCLFLDPDGQDLQARHLCVWDGSGREPADLAGYARLFEPLPAGAEAGPASSARSDSVASLGRIITASAWRGSGLGRRIVAEALLETRRRCGDVPVCIGAQSRLLPFYRAFGFVVAGGDYLEDGMLHTPMRLEPGDADWAGFAELAANTV